MEIKVQNAIFNEIEVQKEEEVRTNLWIPLNSHIYSHSNRKPWHTSFLVAPAGPPCILPQKGQIRAQE